MSNRAIYPDDLAERMKDQAGRKYRPSNGTEGDLFQAAWCVHCRRDAAFRQDPEAAAEGCTILVHTYAYAVDHPRYPGEWQWGEDGQPRCTAFQPMGTDDAYRCDDTPDMFGGQP